MPAVLHRQTNKKSKAWMYKIPLNSLVFSELVFVCRDFIIRLGNNFSARREQSLPSVFIYRSILPCQWWWWGQAVFSPKFLYCIHSNLNGTESSFWLAKKKTHIHIYGQNIALTLQFLSSTLTLQRLLATFSLFIMATCTAFL